VITTNAGTFTTTADIGSTSKLIAELDGCDRCHVQAQTRIMRGDVVMLLLCGHHTNESREMIDNLAAGLRVVDLRHPAFSARD
jgi:hypothetical protein